MGKRFEAGGGLRALEVTEERELAGRVAGLLYLIAAATVALLLLVPGTPVDSLSAVLALSAVGAIWGITCLFAIPWRSVHPLVSHVSTGMGLPLTAAAMAATGGADSPTRFYLLFVVFYVSYFYPPREAIPHLVGCVLVLLVPLTYDQGAIEQGLLAETLVLTPTFLVLGGLIMGGRQILLELSRNDPLTGLVNRRAFEQRLVNSTDGRGDSRPFGLMLCDLDSFKSVNDRHGHPEGDRVLREAAEALRATVRSEDVVARVGGDEFAIVVKDADEEMMRAMADRLDRELALAGTRVKLDGYELAASLGWAIYPRDTPCRKELVSLADIALREQKAARGISAGRTRLLAVGDGG